ncbi:DNA-binding domain-containing protein [Artemisia annua]|uniref:DNA-binding domain-containing protein n=1 Tax=Artemisia annua TaxID=35608 RepID=A0A2U1KR94_ARTAN|nr:DNA-binding domain-containing protein [Artemisia annua]
MSSDTNCKILVIITQGENPSDYLVGFESFKSRCDKKVKVVDYEVHKLWENNNIEWLLRKLHVVALDMSRIAELKNCGIGSNCRIVVDVRETKDQSKGFLDGFDKEETHIGGVYRRFITMFFSRPSESIKCLRDLIQNAAISGGTFTAPDSSGKDVPSISGGTSTSDWLPDGWRVSVWFTSTGHTYTVFKETATRKKFYSKPEVLNYLGIADSSNSNNRKVKVAPPQKELEVSTISTTPSEIPKKLYDLIQNAAKARKSLKLNSNNRFAKRKLEYYEPRIPRVALYYRCTDELPSDWKYSPNYHGSYPLSNHEQKVWNEFTMNDTTKANSCECFPIKNLITVEKDDKVVGLLGKFAVDTFNKSCHMYVNKDEDNTVSGAEFMECKFYKLTKKYIFYMTIEAIEQGIPGVYETRVECKTKNGARALMNFKLTDRKPKRNRPWVKPREPEVEYETVQDGSSDPQDFYKLTGMVHRWTETGGFNYHNPASSPHLLIYASSKDKNASAFEPNVSQLL